MGIETLAVDIQAELKELVGTSAEKSGVSMNEFVATILAEKMKRPDLAGIPRKRPGRPRKPLQEVQA